MIRYLIMINSFNVVIYWLSAFESSLGMLRINKLVVLINNFANFIADKGIPYPLI